MESGFSQAGKPIALEKQRASAVRPHVNETAKLLQPLNQEKSGDFENGGNIEEPEATWDGEGDPVEQMEEKYQELKNKMEEYFDDENGKNCKETPMVKSQSQPTKEEYERHQTTHTPYAAW